MGEEDSSPHGVSEVEIAVGQTNVRIEGSESFIESQLPQILNWANKANTLASTEEEDEDSGGSDDESTQKHLPTVMEAEGGEVDQHSSVDPRMEEVAQKLNVDPSALSSHFYIDDDGVHITNPMAIQPEFALLGYCTIKEEMSGNTYHDNRETKQVLIDQEKIDIERWGSEFLYRLRSEGLIKDDPNTDRSRNKPFKITPKGHQKFINWVTSEDA